MSRPKSVIDDPVVAEVRKVRQEIWREAGECTAGLLRLLDQLMPRSESGRVTTRELDARRRRSKPKRRGRSKIQNPKSKIE